MQLSVLLPSKYPEKRARFIRNMHDTVSNWHDIEIVVCLDGDGDTWSDGNITYCYSPPSKYRSTFHEKPWFEASGRFFLMANDDMIFKTIGWDKRIPYAEYPDDLVMFYFRDNYFNESFACHPIFSRRVMNINPKILSPLYQITKCDNTIWDIHPPHRRVYLPDIEIVHHHEGYGPEWQPAYEEDNRTYIMHTADRARVRNIILDQLGMNPKIMLGVPTAEMARRSDFYDHYQIVEKPKDTICISLHGQSIANNRNKIVEQALAYECSHVFFLDDDVFPPPDIIYSLLSHDKDIVMALQLRRNFPHKPLVFDMELPDNKYRVYDLDDSVIGLVPIVSGGLGCVLIKTEVFKRMEKPWFRLGELEPDQLSEDTGFYLRARKMSFETYCDLNSMVGHAASVIVRPKRVNGRWAIDYDSLGKNSLGFSPVDIEVSDQNRTQVVGNSFK